MQINRSGRSNRNNRNNRSGRITPIIPITPITMKKTALCPHKVAAGIYAEEDEEQDGEIP